MAKLPAQSFRDLIVWQKSHALVASLEELQYFLILCADLSYLPADPVADRANEVGRLLNSYTQNILESRP